MSKIKESLPNQKYVITCKYIILTNLMANTAQ